MPKLRANGINIHYWQSGSGSDVVLSHGLGGNLAGWHLNMVPELQSDYRITTYDLRGHGRTDDPDSGYSCNNMVEDLRGLLDALGIEKADLIGHSIGAEISLQFALVYPERVKRLVVIEAGLLALLANHYRRKEWEGWPYVVRTLERLRGEPVPPENQHDLEYFLNSLLDIPIQFGPSRGRRRKENDVRKVSEFLQPLWNDDQTENELTAGNLSKIRHPTLLLYEKDSIFFKGCEILSEQLENSRTVILNEGTLKHLILLENPDELMAETVAFLAEETLEGHEVAG